MHHARLTRPAPRRTATLVAVLVLGALSVAADDPNVLPDGEITSPAEGSYHLGSVTLGATYEDNPDTYDEVQWAVRPYTNEACTGTNVAGGGPGVSPASGAYTWDGATFSATLDTTGWDLGHYCFVFNTQQDAGEDDVRLIRGFYVADAAVSVGGQLLEGGPKKKDVDAQVSLGGWLASLGEATPPATVADSDLLPCEWNIVLHDVAGDDLDGAHFVGDTCTELNTFEPTASGETDGVVNLTVEGTLDGEDGYSAILRLEDRDEPADGDTIRITLNGPGGEVYDTQEDFTNESDNVGTARTGLDRGNIQVDYR